MSLFDQIAQAACPTLTRDFKYEFADRTTVAGTIHFYHARWDNSITRIEYSFNGNLTRSELLEAVRDVMPSAAIGEWTDIISL